MNSAEQQIGLGKLMTLAAKGFSAVLLFGSGLGVGVWFTTYFDIVPKDDGAHYAATDSDGNYLPSSFSDAVGLAEGGQGPFVFRFTPGENLQYAIDAEIAGQGFEALNPYPVNLNMRSTLDLRTKSVSRNGTGRLEAKFDEVSMNGDFMGSPYFMEHTPESTQMDLGGNPLLTAAMSRDGIPQLEFFQTPIEMDVASNGEVTRLRGSPGMEELMDQMPVFGNLEFPEGNIDPGAQWKSEIQMPIPGFGQAVTTTLLNTFTGYQNIGNRVCAVINQEIDAQQSGGTIQMPESALGEALGIGMPDFKLSGKNEIFFDVANGQMIFGDLNLHLNMDMTQSLGSAGGVIKEIGSSIGDLLSGLPEFERTGTVNAPDEKEHLLDLDLDIRAQISLLGAGEGF